MQTASHISQLIQFIRIADSRGYLPASDGNISLRVDSEKMIITPSGTVKSLVKELDMVSVRLSDGAVLSRGKPSSEWQMHQQIYLHYPDILAVMHSHPAESVVAGILNIELPDNLLAETAPFLGKIRILSFALPSTMVLAKQVAAAFDTARAVILQNHGVVCVGRNIQEAFEATERLNYLAKVALMIQGQQGHRIDQIDVQEILKLYHVKNSGFATFRDKEFGK